jgi:hypothetical protein
MVGSTAESTRSTWKATGRSITTIRGTNAASDVVGKIRKVIRPEAIPGFFPPNDKRANATIHNSDHGSGFDRDSIWMEGSVMTCLRKAGWFVVLAVAMAGWMGLLGSLRGVAEAGVIASRLSETEARSEDLSKIQSFLENKIVVQRLVDYGVSPEETKAKVEAMSPQDLHRLASLTDRAAAGADDGLSLLIGIAILIILVIVILKLMHKEVVIR